MLPPRAGARKIQLRGAFKGATVVRSSVDWKWEDQDGGKGSPGTVLDIQGGNAIEKKIVLRFGLKNSFRLHLDSCAMSNRVGSEAIERLHFLASLPLASTWRREGGKTMQPFNRFQSRLDIISSQNSIGFSS